jgi:hypothetical protein
MDQFKEPVNTTYGVLMPHNNRVTIAYCSLVTSKPTCIEKTDWMLPNNYKVWFVSSHTGAFTLLQVRKRKILFMKLIHVLVDGMYWVLEGPFELENFIQPKPDILLLEDHNKGVSTILPPPSDSVFNTSFSQ